MGRKRIYEFTTASNTIGQYAGVDVSGNAASLKILWPHHIVSSLPASPLTGFVYVLTTATGNYPAGEYRHDGTGWKCVDQHETIDLPDWSGIVSQELVTGVRYNVDVIANVTSLTLTTTSDVGGAYIIISNAAFTIADPIGTEKRGSAGLDDLSEKASVELEIERLGTLYTVSAIERV